MTEAAKAGGLAGRVVLITRPVHQAQALVELVRGAGGEPLVFPAIEIEPVAPSAHGLDLLRRLSQFHWAIFVSANAVAHGMPLIQAAGGWPDTLRAAAVGAATAEALRLQGVGGVLAPRSRADSAALLALPEMQAMDSLRVLVFRGMGGREELAESLRARGASVDYVECYRRRKPSGDASALWARLRAGGLHALTAASGEALANLVELASQDLAAALVGLPLFVTHRNIAEVAAHLGFRDVHATETGDPGLVHAMLVHFGAAD